MSHKLKLQIVKYETFVPKSYIYMNQLFGHDDHETIHLPRQPAKQKIALKLQEVDVFSKEAQYT